MSHYEVLGLHPSATDEEVKKSYKKLAIKYHPDKSSDPKHHELFIKIQKAYEVLKDPSSRRKYDLEKIPGSTTPSNFASSRGGSNTSTRHTTLGNSSFYTYTSFTTTSRSYYDFYDRMHPNFSQRTNVRDYRTQPQPDEIERRRKQEEERIRREQEERERQELDRRLKREAQLRMLKEIEKQRQEQERTSQAGANYYEQRKREAYGQEHRMKGSSNDPIVLSEGEADSDVEVTTESIPTQSQANQDDEVEEEMDGHENEPKEEFYAPGKAGEEKFAAQSNGSNDPDGRASSRPYLKTDPYSERLFPNKSLEDYFDLNGDMKIRDRQQPPRYKLFMERGGLPNVATSEYSTPKTEAILSNVRERSAKPLKPNKKTKLNNHWNLNDLSNTLDSENAFETKPMDDLLESLPQDLQDTEESDRKKTRKALQNLSQGKAKKTKFEFTDGRTRADTLHRPVNGTQYKAYVALQMLDLGADPEILNVYPPANPNLGSISVTSIAGAMRVYLASFFTYKKQVLEYQFQRIQKDQELSESLLSSTSNFNVYSQCLLQDAVVTERYLKALIENSGVFRDFQRLSQ